jgi:transcriptional regulator with XRE-family HTH domain
VTKTGKQSKKVTAEQEFGRFVRVKRAELGITLYELSMQVGLSTTYIAKIERGEMPAPPDLRLFQLAKALKVEADEMFWRARRLGPELRKLLGVHPREYYDLLALTEGFSRDQLELLVDKARHLRQVGFGVSQEARPSGGSHKRRSKKRPKKSAT